MRVGGRVIFSRKFLRENPEHPNKNYSAEIQKLSLDEESKVLVTLTDGNIFLSEDLTFVPDYWCIVAYMRDYDIPILKMSEDCRLNDVFEEIDWTENNGDRIWIKTRKPGIYKLWIRPWAFGPDMQGDWDSGMDAYKIKLLYEFDMNDLVETNEIIV